MIATRAPDFCDADRGREYRD